jgi:acetone carboxylase gamma subunit
MSDNAPNIQWQGQHAFLCASCGIPVRMEWAAPGWGLCEACEERVMQQSVSYSPMDDQTTKKGEV